MTYIVFDDTPEAASFPLGGKAGALAQLSKAGLPIPRWFVILPQAFSDSLSPEDQARLNDEAQRKTILENLVPSPEIAQAIQAAAAKLFAPESRVAVRSSAQDEDGDAHSYAGMLESYLFIPPDGIADYIAQVWRSAFSARILAYRQEHNVSGLPSPPAVLIQQMVPADVSGVAFGADPLTGNPNMLVIAAVYGLGTALVSGESDADTLYLTGNGELMHYHCAEKTLKHQMSQASGEHGYLETVAVPNSQTKQPVLEPDHAALITRLIRTCNQVFQAPQDIEWAFAGDHLFLLQCRPITTLPDYIPPPYADERFSWDNGLTAESWPGVVTPLTGSISRILLEAVYKGLTETTCIPKRPIAEFHDLYPQLVGMIRGRVYLNETVLSAIWFEAPSVAYRIADWKRHWQYLKDYVRSEQKRVLATVSPFSRDFLGTWLSVTRQVLVGSVKVARHYTCISREARHLEREVRQLKPLLAKESSLHSKLERILDLLRYQAGVSAFNSYAGDILYAVWGRQCGRWLGKDGAALGERILAQRAKTVAQELTRQLATLVNLAQSDGMLLDALTHESVSEIQQRISENSEFQNAYYAYLDEFGDRCAEDLKLESQSLRQDPLTFFRSIAAMASVTGKAAEAEVKADYPLTLSWHKRLLLDWILQETCQTIAFRERNRLCLTRLMGALREVISEIDASWCQSGHLKESRDSLFLEFGEIQAGLKEMPIGDAMKQRIAQRKDAFGIYQQKAEPPSQFATWGLGDWDERLTPKPAYPVIQSDTLQATGSSSGICSGEVIWYTPETDPAAYRDKILIAEFGDPSLVIVFPLLKGLILLRGNPLSHAAIVARELNIPTVVATGPLQHWLQTGDDIELNGQSGRIRKISP